MGLDAGSREMPRKAEVAGEGHANGAIDGQAKGGDESSSNMTAKSFVKDSMPSFAAAAVMLGFIFGGCCSNVYALESIINYEPASGTLLTFIQFTFVAITGYIAQFSPSHPPFYLRPNVVPLSRWVVNIVLFFAINVLNNHAFSYDISVPVHVILRSGGSITTMIAGWAVGRRYSRVQAMAVVCLTFGVGLAAWSDAQTKGSSADEKPTFGTGLVILFVAQVLSAIMGLYTEVIYDKYGKHWRENLFYSHALSLPLFLPFAPSMFRTLKHLYASEPLSSPLNLPLPILEAVPSQLVFVAANVLTQYACIRGVNLLAAATSALTVTIVLSIRKLVSLLLSIWLFGNSLATGTMVGAVIVFGSGALYSLGSKKDVGGSEGSKEGKEKKEQ